MSIDNNCAIKKHNKCYPFKPTVSLFLIFLIYELVEKSTETTGLINLRLKGLQKAGCMGFLLDHCQLLNFEKIRAAVTGEAVRDQ